MNRIFAIFYMECFKMKSYLFLFLDEGKENHGTARRHNSYGNAVLIEHAVLKEVTPLISGNILKVQGRLKGQGWSSERICSWCISAIV